MKRALRQTLVVALVCLPMWTVILTPVSAKPFYRNWKWWAGSAAIGGAIALDMISTARVEYVCSGCGETNIFLSPRPSHGQLIGYGVGVWAAESGIHALMYHYSGTGDRGTKWPWKAVGYGAWPSTSWGLHGLYAARHNYTVANQVYQNHVNLDIPLPGGQTPWRR